MPSIRFFASRKGMIVAGATIGLLAALLQWQGNPANMGLCMVCFPRDMAGAIGLHRAAVVQYLRPEILAVVFGALVSALAAGEWRPRGGSAPIVRFFLGVFAVIGALAFLGCPWRALLRLAGGDMNALTGLAGLVVGVGVGSLFLKHGYSLGRSHRMPRPAAVVWPLAMALLLLLLLQKTSFAEGQAIFFSEKGPGAKHAPVWISLAFGLAIGFVAQRTRFCTMGAIRDALLIRDFHLLSGIAALVAGALAVNVVLTIAAAASGDQTAVPALRFGLEGMPISHTNHLWNFLGMVLAGLTFTLAGGCPGRQFFLSGEGDTDAAVFCCGMLFGAGIAHNWFLAAKPDAMAEGAVQQLGGPSWYGQIAVLIGIAFCIILGLTTRAEK